MINIDSVYKTVLAIIAKDNRGWLPPADFNYLAKQAQLDIFAKLFTDYAHFSASRKGMVYDTGYSDMKKNLRNSIDVFAKQAALVAQTAGDPAINTNTFDLPSDLYRIDTILYNDGTTSRVVEEMIKSDSPYIMASKLTQPRAQAPKYKRYEDTLEVYPTNINSALTIEYIKKPATPKWGYVGGTRNPVNDEDSSVDFDLHTSMQYVLVSKILQLTGVHLREVDIVNFATADLTEDQTIEKS